MYFIESYTNPLPEHIRAAFTGLYRQTFNTEPGEKVYERIDNAIDLHMLIAFSADREPIAFKSGYRHDLYTFYSWLGGVVADYRNQGVASMLLQRQHEWCTEKGYQVIQTKTLNRWRNMLLLDLRHGFDIVGIQQGKDNALRIILEKKLSNHIDADKINFPLPDERRD